MRVAAMLVAAAMMPQAPAGQLLSPNALPPNALPLRALPPRALPPNALPPRALPPRVQPPRASLRAPLRAPPRALPGLWESVARTDIGSAPGLDPAAAALVRRMVARPVIERACVTAAAIDADRAAMVAAGDGCSLGPVRIAGGRLAIERRCAAAGTVTQLRGPVTAKTYLLTGIVTAVSPAPAMAPGMAPAMAVTLAVAGRRLGPCPR